jgi:hypothetical protein
MSQKWPQNCQKWGFAKTAKSGQILPIAPNIILGFCQFSMICPSPGQKYPPDLGYAGEGVYPRGGGGLGGEVPHGRGGGGGGMGIPPPGRGSREGGFWGGFGGVPKGVKKGGCLLIKD